MQLLVEMQVEVAPDVEVNHPSLAQRKEFGDFRKHVEILKGLVAERRLTADAISNLCAYERKASDIVVGIFAGISPAPVEASRPAAPSSDASDWETVKTMGVQDL